MMRKGLSYIEILVAMCDRVFDTTEAAGAFLSTGTVRNFVCGEAVDHQAVMALMKRSPKRTAN